MDDITRKSFWVRLRGLAELLTTELQAFRRHESAPTLSADDLENLAADHERFAKWVRHLAAEINAGKEAV
jgi:hypothetical protein